MKKILITGGTGFIGSHLAEKCVEIGYKVTIFDRYNPNYSLGNLENSKYKNRINFVFGDIRDFDSVNRVVKKKDVVIHLAALIGIPYSYISPSAYIKTNIEGTYNLLESCKNNKILKTIITSTSEVYGSAKYTPIDEKHPLKPQSPYSASKISADNLSLSYYYSFGLPLTILRPFNNYGPRQSLRAVIPTIINQIIHNKNGIIELGNINSIRDFLFVEDTCSAYIKCIRKSKFRGEVINLGTGSQVTIKDVVKIISKILNKKIVVVKSNKRIRPKNSEVDKLCASIKKANSKINWKPKYYGKKGFERGLITTVDWYLKFFQNKFTKKYII